MKGKVKKGMAVVYYNGTVDYEGCVMRTYEHNGYDDSDFYAVCVNIDNGTIDTVEYDTTRCGGNGSAKVDLTESNYRRYQRKAYMRQITDGLKRNRTTAAQVEIGKEVVVVKGRKVPIGTKGVVFWRKEVNYDRYNRWYKATMRIGIKDSDGVVYWLNESNVEVADPERYIKPAQQIIKACKEGRSKEYLSIKRAFAW